MNDKEKKADDIVLLLYYRNRLVEHVEMKELLVKRLVNIHARYEILQKHIVSNQASEDVFALYESGKNLVEVTERAIVQADGMYEKDKAKIDMLVAKLGA